MWIRILIGTTVVRIAIVVSYIFVMSRFCCLLLLRSFESDLVSLWNKPYKTSGPTSGPAGNLLPHKFTWFILLKYSDAKSTQVALINFHFKQLKMESRTTMP